MEAEKRWMRWIVVLMFIASCKQQIPGFFNDENSADSSERKVLLMPDGRPLADSNMRTIYLTFDDGPNSGTPNVMHILKQEKLPATFFLVGTHLKEIPHASQYLDSLRAMPNVELCNHSYTHGFHNHFESFYTGQAANAADDFIRCADSVGFNNNIVRAPGNNIWRTPTYSQTTYQRYKPSANAVADSGFLIMGWDAEWRYKSLDLVQSSHQMAREIDSLFEHNQNRFKQHCVLLMHDLTFRDSKDSSSLVALLQQLKADNRYRFDVASAHPLLRYDERKGTYKRRLRSKPV